MYIKPQNIIIASDSQCFLFWVRSATKLSNDICYVVAKLKLCLHELQLSPFENYYFWNQDIEQFPCDCLTKIRPGNQRGAKINPKSGKTILQIYDKLQTNNMFLVPREKWNRFLTNDIYVPDIDLFHNLYKDLSLNRHITKEEVKQEI